MDDDDDNLGDNKKKKSSSLKKRSRSSSSTEDDDDQADNDGLKQQPDHTKTRQGKRHDPDPAMYERAATSLLLQQQQRGPRPAYRDPQQHHQQQHNEDLLTEYRLLLARQETLQDQIRLVEARLAQRRWLETALGGGGGGTGPPGMIPGLSSLTAASRDHHQHQHHHILGGGAAADHHQHRLFAGDNTTTLLEQARADLLRRERQALLLDHEHQQHQQQQHGLAAGRSASASYASLSAQAESDAAALRLFREREMLLARLSPLGGGGTGGGRGGGGGGLLSDRSLLPASADDFRRGTGGTTTGLYSGGSSSLIPQPISSGVEPTLEDLLAARSRGTDRFAPASSLRGANQQTALSRSRLEESLGLAGTGGGGRRNSPPRQQQQQQQSASLSPRHRYDDGGGDTAAAAYGPADQLHILQQIDRQRRINETLMEQARLRDLTASTTATTATTTTLAQGVGRPSAAAPAAAAASSSSSTLLREMRGSPGAARDFRAGVIMSVEADREKLSAFQALIRQSLEYFEATDDDVLTSVQGRRQKIRLGQSKYFWSTSSSSLCRLSLTCVPFYRHVSVGVRCKYCSHLPIRSMARAKVRCAIEVTWASDSISLFPPTSSQTGSRVLSQNVDQRLPRYVRFEMDGVRVRSFVCCAIKAGPLSHFRGRGQSWFVVLLLTTY